MQIMAFENSMFFPSVFKEMLSIGSVFRFSAIVFPISHRSSVHRTRWLLVVAWSMAILCSIPQSIVFSLQTHPIIRTYRQCMNTITITNKQHELLYFGYFIILSWILPILVMLICYLSIIITIYRRTKFNHIIKDNNSKSLSGISNKT